MRFVVLLKFDVTISYSQSECTFVAVDIFFFLNVQIFKLRGFFKTNVKCTFSDRGLIGELLVLSNCAIVSAGKASKSTERTWSEWL